MNRRNDTAKRAVDIGLSVLALPVLAAATAVVGPLIKREDDGPIFYTSQRLGRGMRPFTMYKFRTMRVNAPDIRNADGSTFSAEDDPRVTRVGRILRKTSVDELPQLLNVLRGDMSLVGPRPSPLGNESRYDDTFRRRFEVRPGITGYSQALNRNDDSLEERGRTDAYYVDNRSLMLDLSIMLRTVLRVVSTRSINRTPAQSNRSA